jgi:hypothetical protein
MRYSLLLLSFLFTGLLFGQKKIIDHTAYNGWKKNENQLVSPNGKYVSFEINPHRGDGFLYIYNVDSGKMDSIPRGKGAQFSMNSDYIAFRILPGFDTLRNCELNKVDKKKWPKDSLGIYLLASDSLIKIPLLKSFSVGEDHNLLSYIVDENVIKNDDNTAKKTKKKCFLAKKEKKAPAIKSDGKLLTVLNPLSSRTDQFINVTDYVISQKGDNLCFIRHQKMKLDSNQLFLRQFPSMDLNPISKKYTSITSLTFDHSGKNIAYLASNDTTDAKAYGLYIYSLETKTTRSVDTSDARIGGGNSVTENFDLLFTKDGNYLFFGVDERPVVVKKDTLLDKEKVEVDIWHYADKRLQSQQLVELKRDEKRSTLFRFRMSDDNIVKLAEDTLSVRLTDNVKGSYLFAASDERYALEKQWEVPGREDHYRISLVDGSIELIKEGVEFNGVLSPSGNLYSWFDGTNGQFYIKNLSSNKENCMTCSVKNVNWQTDANGMPLVPEPYGRAGYSSDEQFLYIHSAYDLWMYNTRLGVMTCVTEGMGQASKIRMELNLWDMDSVYIDASNAYISGFDEKTKGAHLYELIDHQGHLDVKEMYYTDHKINFLARSKNGESIIFRKMSISMYPDVRLTTDNFSNERQVSVTNAQQSEYNWAKVELVNWKSYSGIPLEGLLYKPENFDPTKKYPLMIYYYELNSDELFNHSVPKPTASIIYPTEYASAGYVVFIPDIRYKVGHPAQSAYDCIMSGTDHVLKLVPAIDSTRMGLQGQSWGGYQTAQLITMTTRYRAAMAGAPVSNMFSAYGGIRWGSGVNRQFQYERTQSRIGKTIWDAPELYRENSPLFHLPNVHTPLLIMANDKDGAVPWYQGIELFTGMRRLGKPCWLLNYNGDDHNLMENANRIDLSIRMRQFFDHYLQGAPAPLWLTDGIPAVDKGKTMGY